MRWPHGKRVISAGTPYLTRYYLKGDGSGESWELYLHRLHKADGDRRAHNHPWSWFLSFVLCGWYLQERVWQDAGVPRFSMFMHREQTRVRWFNRFRGPGNFHRITAVSRRPCWTLVLVPKKNVPYSWGFASGAGFIEHTKAAAQYPTEIVLF